ncbi:integrase core domain-containing protein, partial [Nocardia sp. CWNU-33]|uniref:integrase core domain-containing protein n=1 Tax=Nocardia sp. CWNU-33 TaxID=3392117 RepID=UPI00398E4F2D
SANAKSSVVSNDSSHEKSSPPYPDQAPSNRSPQQLDKHRSIERYNRILAEEFLYAREWASETHRTQALGIWNIHYNYHRPHSAAENRPPASRLPTGVTNVTASYI